MDIIIEVAGELPPAKNEALSMLSAGHSQARRVRALLGEAARMMDGRSPLTGPIAVDVTVSGPPGARLPDATNMLGGIGDVLQARATGADVTDLGALADVACYEDDSQFIQITYRQTTGTYGYQITITALDPNG